MKCIIIVILFVLLTMSVLPIVSAQEIKALELIAIRSKIFKQSEAIKPLLNDSRDAVLVSSMWDSCIMTTLQLDAYFFMIGIFNTIKGKDAIADAVGYLYKWLTYIKDTNNMSIKSLNSVSYEVEPETKSYVRIIKDTLDELNKIIDNEIRKISVLELAAGESR
jgi:hypothetical protein